MGDGARVITALLTAMTVALGVYGRATCHRDTTSGPRPDPRVPPANGPDAQEERVAPADVGQVGEPRESQMLNTKLQELRKGGRDTVVYVAPAEDEERAYRSWIRDVADRASRGDAPPDTAPPGFVLDRTSGSDDVWLLAERASHRRGAGAVAIRVGRQAAGLIVEAPHTFFDAGTLPIALTAFQRLGCRALLINTVHRYNPRLRGESSDGEGGEDGGDVSASDVAHAPHSFFLAAHEELQVAFPRATAVQLHGFRDEVLDGVSIVLSAAGTRADANLVASSLRAAPSATLGGPHAVRVFPDDVRILGGTLNAQARSSARAAAPFLHVEMSKSLRDNMVADTRVRGQFVVALLGPLASSPAPHDAAKH